MTGLGVFMGVLVLVTYTMICGLLFTSIGSSFGHKASEKEVARRVVLAEGLDVDAKIEILRIINDDIYWKENAEAICEST